jgi:hypothetical protein
MDDPLKDLSSRLRGWYDRSPKVQRAYEKLTADVDAVHAKVTSVVEDTEALRDIRDKVAAAIDPPAPVAAPPEADVQAAAPPETAAQTVAAPTEVAPGPLVEPVVTATTAAAPAEPTPQPPMGLPIHTGTMPDSTPPPPPTQGSPLP